VIPNSYDSPPLSPGPFDCVLRFLQIFALLLRERLQWRFLSEVTLAKRTDQEVASGRLSQLRPWEP